MPISEAVRQLERDLRGIFGSRLQSLVIYGAHERGGSRSHGHQPHGNHAATRTLAVIEAMTLDDLRATARQVERWHDAGLATPLVLESREFERSLDAFPLEFGAIIAAHVVVAGNDPFAALSVDPADVRRACEVQARSHLLHLREGFLETRGRSDALSVLIAESAPAFSALVASLAWLDGLAGGDPAAAARHVERKVGLPDGPIAKVVTLVHTRDLSSADAEGLFAPYFDAVEKIVAYVDGWIDAR
jgi:hypothetical protein